METEGAQKPWYRKVRYIVPIAILIVLLALPLFSYLYAVPPSADQVRLNMTIDYFANNYDLVTGLIPVTPTSHTFWLFSDNYLVLLAVARYDPSNSSTSGFASALNAALYGYAATLPPILTQNQYTALNSTTAYFDCSANYQLSWSASGQLIPGSGTASLLTTANDQSPACATQNYADLLFLQALYYHRLGNSTAASDYYELASSDYDGRGVADQAFNGTLYQTYKLALFVYTASCLGYSPATNETAAVATLFSLQDNSTGGFYTGYTVNLTSLNASQLTPGGGVNTETTALAALALEQLINPSGAC
jgi:hypothetical protein